MFDFDGSTSEFEKHLASTPLGYWNRNLHREIVVYYYLKKPHRHADFIVPRVALAAAR